MGNVSAMNAGQEKAKRIDYIDWIKGIGILSIVLAHVTQYFPGGLSWLNKIACSYHVPIFFVACGLLAALSPRIYDISIWAFVKKRFIGLIIPYIIFSLFNSALKFGVLILTHGLTSDVVIDELWELFVSGNGTQWFLLALFLIELLYMLLKDKFYISAVVAVIGIVVPFLLQNVSNPFAVVGVRVIYGYAYFIIGYLTLNVLRRCEKNSIFGVVGGVLVAIGIACSFAFHYKIEFFAGIYENGIVAFPCSLCFSFGFIFIMYALRNVQNNVILKVLNYFGQNSIVVMLIHTTMLLFVTYPFGNWMKALVGVQSVVIGLGLYVITLLLQVPVVYVVDRWFPILRGRMR